MTIRTTLLAGLVIAGLSATVLPVAAHHSFSVFNTAETKTVTGTVKEVEWTNPHIWLWVNVTNDKGGVDVYAFEGMSPNFLERRGWTRTTLKPGDKITIDYNPLRDGKNGGMFRTGRMENGKTLTMGGSQ
jgi:DNA/RNA endonuclease YhcR with UshA esterase domain